MTAVIGNPDILRKIVKNEIDFDAQVQMCGVDLTVSRIEQFVDETFREYMPRLDFDNSNRKFGKTIHCPYFIDGEEGNIELDVCYEIPPGTYLVRYNEEINVPKNAMGIVYPRSSLMRMGSTLQSAIWDPGYKGQGCGLLIVGSSIIIQKNAKIGQIVFFTTDAQKEYNGIFQNERTDKE